MWQEFSGKVTGTMITGDRDVPATYWWNVPLLILFFWRTVQVFEVPSGVTKYQVGFIPFEGQPKLREKPVTTPEFAVRIGREDCRFFALDMRGVELPLIPFKRTRKSELSPSITLV